MFLTILQRAALAALCFFSLLSIGPSHAIANDANHIVARAWFEDPTNKMTFEEVRASAFKPYRWFLSGGFGDSTIWVRLTIDPHTDKAVFGPGASSLILKIRPLYLDEIELFDPADQSDRRRITGDQYPARAAEFQSLNFNFVIARGEGPRDIYLRIRSTSTRLFHAEAFHLQDLQREDRTQQLLFGIYLALVSLFLVWAAISWLASRDPVISAFLVTQFFALCIGLSIFGYVRDFLGGVLPPQIIDNITSYSSLLIVSAAIFFYIRFWKEYKPAKFLLRLLELVLVISLVNLALLIIGHTRLALHNNMMLIMSIPIVTFMMVFTAKGWDSAHPADRPLVPKSLIFMYFFVNLLVLLAGALPGLGLATGGAYSIYVGLAHGIINGAFAVGILQYRSYLLSQRRATLAMELTIAQQEVRQERAFREERERLLAMLAHELRTPLATVRMLVGQQELDSRTIDQIKQSISEMNSVIQRSVQVNQLDESRLQPSLSEVDLIGELTELIERSGLNWYEVDLKAPATQKLKTDPQLLRIILSNIIENAVKYRAPKSTITVSVNKFGEGGAVEVIVENLPGPAGFPDPDKVYDKYYRSPMAHRQTGSGLGMYLVKGLVSSLKGKIEYRPTQEKVRFILWLPDSLS